MSRLTGRTCPRCNKKVTERHCPSVVCAWYRCKDCKIVFNSKGATVKA